MKNKKSMDGLPYLNDTAQKQLNKFLWRKKQMSETQSPTRSLNEINQAYARAAAQAGDIQYRIFALNEELSKVNSELRALNIEGFQAQQDEKETPT